MRILLSNDDGYKAGGIMALAQVMSRYGEIKVIAPKNHQSATSMAVSLGGQRLAHKRLEDFGPGEWHYLDATPASCIKFGLEYFYEHRNPDLVVTGINHGSNSSSAANYSATMGAAEEAAINGIKAIGVSLCNFSADADFSMVKKYLPGVIDFLLENWPPDSYGLYYNVNFPDVEVPLGVKFTRQGKGHWEKEFKLWDGDMEGLEEGETPYKMIGDFIDDEPQAQEADHVANGAGWISITPFSIDSTDFEELTRLCQL